MKYKLILLLLTFFVSFNSFSKEKKYFLSDDYDSSATIELINNDIFSDVRLVSWEKGFENNIIYRFSDSKEAELFYNDLKSYCNNYDTFIHFFIQQSTSPRMKNIEIKKYNEIDSKEIITIAIVDNTEYIRPDKNSDYPEINFQKKLQNKQNVGVYNTYIMILDLDNEKNYVYGLAKYNKYYYCFRIPESMKETLLNNRNKSFNLCGKLVVKAENDFYLDVENITMN